jgi:hypothetical protein
MIYLSISKTSSVAREIKDERKAHKQIETDTSSHFGTLPSRHTGEKMLVNKKLAILKMLLGDKIFGN